MLLREQIKLLKGQNKKLKTENKEYRHKLKDCGEWDGAATSGSTSQSESVSSCIVSPRESPPSSKESSRVPSESPSHPHPHHHEEGGMISSSSSERIRLRHSLSSSSAANSGSGAGMGLRSDEKGSAKMNLENEVGEKDIDSDEVRDVPGSLPSSSSGGMGVSAKADSQNGFTSKSKPIPIPRSTTLSVGGASDVVKANEGKVTRGFLMRVQSLDSGTSSNVKTVKLESFVPKPESPIPKPRVVTSRSQAVTDSPSEQSAGDSNKMKLGDENQEKTDDSNEAKDGRDVEESGSSNKETEEKILKARKLLENVLPHPSSQRPTKPPRSMSAREEEGLKAEVPLLQRATSSSPIGKVGTVTLGDDKSPIFPGKQQGKSSAGTGAEKIEDDGEEVDEKAASMTSSNTSSTSSITKMSPLPIAKPLPPPPFSSSSLATKPLPLAPSSLSSIPPKPLPPTPSSSSTTKPLPPMPLSSSVPKPLPPAPSPPLLSSSATKPLPPKPIKMSTSVPPSPPPSALSSGKEKSGSISPKTPTARIVAGYKKVTIQSDTSWINRKKESSGHECTDHPLETSTQSTGSAGGVSVTTPTSVQSPGPGGANRPHAPYRSHAILPGPSSGSSGSKTSMLSPGKSYGGSSEVKPGTCEACSLHLSLSPSLS